MIIVVIYSIFVKKFFRLTNKIGFSLFPKETKISCSEI